MNDNKDNKDQKKSGENLDKKLTLSTPKLTLNRNLSTSTLSRKSMGNSSGFTVEVKKTASLSASSLLAKKTVKLSDSAPENEDIERRISLLKKAAEDTKNKEQDSFLKSQRINEENAKLRDVEDDNAKNSEKLTLKEDIQEITENIIAAKKEAEILPKPQVFVQAVEITDDQFIKPKQTKQKSKTDFEDDEDDKKKIGATKTLNPKVLKEEPKKIQKNLLINISDEDEAIEIGFKSRSLASIRRAREKEKRKAQQKPIEKIYREVILPEFITVGELASRMSERAADVIKELMKLGIIASANQSIDADTAEIVIEIMGHKCKRIKDSDVENILEIPVDNPEDMKSRPPVVTVMGHVDHGKTSLLDALKSTDIAKGEAGGITQHIGAYSVKLASGASITFLDTPGHEAFTEMRSRGAKITDIVVLVVAADDGIMPQTIEAISHAKAAKVPIIVAINKIDKPDANIDRVKHELLQHDLVPEDFGGDVITVPVSALKGTNLDKLEEAILLVAEMQDLKANPNCQASGAVVEAKIDKGAGVIATIIVQRGTLEIGDVVVAGESFGKIKKMIDDKSRSVQTCIPSQAVEIWGLDKAPLAGDTVSVVQTEKLARDITEYRFRKSLDKKNVIEKEAKSIDDLFLRASGTSNIKDLALIIKADVQGSVEAIVSSLSKINDPEVRIKILHKAAGAVTESDVSLASASNALILAFNVRAGPKAILHAEKDSVMIKYYSIIYSLIDDIKSVVTGMLSPIIREEFTGNVEIREVFTITKVGKVAGCYVTKGHVKKNSSVRLIRDNIVIYQGKIKTLKRFKDDVKEVRENYECGVVIDNYDDIKQGDIIEAFDIIEEKRSL